ncbi:MAG: MFS transporter, partial [Pseudomonadota bacterium]|nr:MFS transporter [Pseudomonadota bacterium]
MGMATFGIIVLAYVLSQFFRSFLAVVAPQLATDLGLGPAELGSLSAVWFAAFALAQFPIGWALDTIGPRRTVGGLMLAATAGSLLFSAAQGFTAGALAMALIGIGCAPVFMGGLYVLGRSYPPDRFVALSSVLFGIGNAGNLLAATPLALAAEALGWRTSMGAIAGLTFITALLLVLLLKDPPPAAGAEQGGTALGALLSIVSLRALWPLIPLTLVGYAVVAAERSLWAGPYLSEVHGLGAVSRANGVLAMAVAMSVGAFAYGPLERLLRGPKSAVLLGSLITGALFVALGSLPRVSASFAVTALSLVGGFGLTYTILMAHARRFFPDHLLGRGVTFFNFLAIGGAGLV